MNVRTETKYRCDTCGGGFSSPEDAVKHEIPCVISRLLVISGQSLRPGARRLLHGKRLEELWNAATPDDRWTMAMVCCEQVVKHAAEIREYTEETLPFLPADDSPTAT